MSTKLGRIERANITFARILALLGLFALVAVALATIIDAIARSIFGAPIEGISEILRLVIAIAMTSFFPTALAEKHHIAIKFLGNALGQRWTRFLDAFGAIVTFATFNMMGYQFIIYVFELHENKETTWLLGLALAPWWSVATLFILFCVPVQLVVLSNGFRDIKRARATSLNEQERGG